MVFCVFLQPSISQNPRCKNFLFSHMLCRIWFSTIWQNKKLGSAIYRVPKLAKNWFWVLPRLHHFWSMLCLSWLHSMDICDFHICCAELSPLQNFFTCQGAFMCPWWLKWGQKPNLGSKDMSKWRVWLPVKKIKMFCGWCTKQRLWKSIEGFSHTISPGTSGFIRLAL